MHQSIESHNDHAANDACLASAVGTYREWRVNGPLSAHLACTWMHALPPSAALTLQVVPDGCIDIVWSGDSVRIAGPDTRPIFESFRPGAVITGVRFLPGAAPAWLGVPASEVVNARPPLQDLWGADAHRLTDRLRETRDPVDASGKIMSALLARTPTASLMDSAARAVLHVLARDDGGPVGISQLAAALDLSERTLRRRCESAFGYGPKTLARILRFQRFLRLLRRSREPRLAELAAASGYVDQAHLSRDVRRLGGLTPSEFKTLLAA